MRVIEMIDMIEMIVTLPRRVRCAYEDWFEFMGREVLPARPGEPHSYLRAIIEQLDGGPEPEPGPAVR